MLQPRSIQSSLGIRDKILSLDFILIISILVLGVSTQSSGPGPLVTHITSRGASTCRVPVTLVPDVMTDEAIDALT